MWQTTATWPCDNSGSILDRLREELANILFEFYGSERGKILDVISGFDGAIPSSDLPVLILFPSEGIINAYQDMYAYEILVYHSVWNSGTRFEHLKESVELRQFIARRLASLASTSLTFVNLQEGMSYTAVVQEEYSGSVYHFFAVKVPVIEQLDVIPSTTVTISGGLALQ